MRSRCGGRCGIEELSARVFSVDGTPTDCVNIAVTHGAQGPARPRRVRDQQGLQHRRRRDVLGNGGGRARGGAAGDSGHRGVAARAGAEYHFGTRRARRSRWPRPCCGVRWPARAFLNVNVPRGPIRGYRTAVQARRNHVTSVERAHRSARARVPTGSTKAQDDWQPHDDSDYQAVSRRLRRRDAAAPGPHGARAARGTWMRWASRRRMLVATRTGRSANALAELRISTDDRRCARREAEVG